MPKAPKLPTVYTPKPKKGKKPGRKSFVNKNQRRLLEQLEESESGSGPKTGAK